jgi:hypothetical protein
VPAIIPQTEIKLDYAEAILDELGILEEGDSVTTYYHLDNFKTTKIDVTSP